MPRQDDAQMVEKLPQGDLTAVVLHFNDKFDRHVEQEIERYDDLKDLIDQQMNASEVRHEETGRRIEALIQSIASLRNEEKMYHAAPCQALIDAVPDGDIPGHRKAHEAMIQAAKDARETLQYVKKVVLTAAVISVGSWVLLSTWHTFLMGPK